MLAEARRLGIPVIDDAAVLERLINRHAIGDRIRQDLYNPVARILVNLGL
jgi:type III secretory pathway component EscU